MVEKRGVEGCVDKKKEVEVEVLMLMLMLPSGAYDP